jgi:agmatinase
MRFGIGSNAAPVCPAPPFRLPVRPTFHEGGRRSPAAASAVAGIAWDGSSPTAPARASARAPSARPATCCATARTRTSTSRPGPAGDPATCRCPTPRWPHARGAGAAAAAAAARTTWCGWAATTPSRCRCCAPTAWLGRPLAVIHFDAHCDTWTDHFGEPSGHGTWVYEAMQEGLVMPPASCRSASARPASAQRATTCATRAARSSPRATCAAWTIAGAAGAGAAPCGRGWPRWAPAGLPQPGHRLPGPGLRTRHRHARARRPEHQPGADAAGRAGALPFVGMDCVEVAPPYDHAELTSYAAAHFVWTYLCGGIANSGP